MLELPGLVELPWATLLTLVCGYTAYFVANVGMREHHKTVDVAFTTLVFGFFAMLPYMPMRRSWHIDDPWRSAICFLLALALGGLWSLFGRRLMEWSLRRSLVSHADDYPSALATIFTVKTHHATQLSVKLKDGTWLKCEDLHRFRDAPNGPFRLGGEGDLLMYVTHWQGKDENEFELCDAVETNWGAEITYLPASEIARIDLRRNLRR